MTTPPDQEKDLVVYKCGWCKKPIPKNQGHCGDICWRLDLISQEPRRSSL